MLLPAVGTVRARADKISCMNNLRNLYLGANSYMQQYNQWPQVTVSPTQSQQYDEQWIEALLPLSTPRSCWICPATERLLGNPNYTNPQYYRADYMAFPFDPKPMTPYQWANMPWFCEKGSVHGNGNLMIFMNGSIQELNDVEQTLSGGN